MSELKTLREIFDENQEIPLILFPMEYNNVLREEVIKWIEELELEISRVKSSPSFRNPKERKYPDVLSRIKADNRYIKEKKEIIKWIKHFFSI